jgi:hypothetical protein
LWKRDVRAAGSSSVELRSGISDCDSNSWQSARALQVRLAGAPAWAHHGMAGLALTCGHLKLLKIGKLIGG